MLFLWSFLLAFVLTSICMWGFIRAAIPLQLVDRPDWRKQHIKPTPVVGGLAMAAGAALATFAFSVGYYRTSAFWSAALLLLVAGFADDRGELSTGVKAATQVTVAIVAIFVGGLAIDDVGNVLGFGEFQLGGYSVLFTVFAIVGLINAVNMIDGLDGLAGTLVLQILLLLFFTELSRGFTSNALGVAPLMGAICGFLLFNFRFGKHDRAKAFMGDAGSMVLGFTLAWYVVDMSASQGGRVFSPVVALWILAVPVLDTVSIMVSRIVTKRSPFEPDSGHLHHVLLRTGIGVRGVVALLVAINLAMGLLGMYLDAKGVHEYILFWVFVGIIVLMTIAYIKVNPRPVQRHPDRR